MYQIGEIGGVIILARTGSTTDANVCRAIFRAQVSSGSGVGLIGRERRRQIEEEGRTPEHDDQHTDQSILHAAGWIINDLEAAATHESDADPDDPDARWPEKLAVHVREKYGDDRVRRLTIAGALIAAEIDRLLRAAGVDAGPPTHEANSIG